MRLFLMFAIVSWLLVRHAFASTTMAERDASAAARQEIAKATPGGNLPDYQLPAGELAKAQHLASLHRKAHFADEIWGVLQLVLLLRLGAVARMRDVAGRKGRGRWAQAYVFTSQLLLALWLLNLPLDLGLHHLSLRYGLSVETWPGWFVDQAKSLALEWLIGGALLVLFFWTVRRFPRRWWLAFWVCTLPITVFGLFVMPYVEPVFFHYEPLGQSHPELVQRLETVVAKGHMNIPPERMFLMQASSKLTTLNADVEGFGSSKRVVVWDTSIQKFNPDQILFVFAHETGHYVLGHIVRGLLMSFVGTFALFFSGFFAVRSLLTHLGPRWRIPSQEDLGTAVVLLLVIAVLSAGLEPVSAVISRRQEHAADVYGQEAIHGLVANPQETARTAFDVLGATSLAEPNPPRWYEFWTYSHPSTGRRAAFAKAYDPWQPGLRPKYFPPQPQGTPR